MIGLFKPRKTSAQWQSLKPKVIVVDADGWDRRNYEHAWNTERITEDEYVRRRNKSTCKWTTSPLYLTEAD